MGFSETLAFGIPPFMSLFTRNERSEVSRSLTIGPVLVEIAMDELPEARGNILSAG